MNSSEEKQVLMLGRILKRDPERIRSLINQQRLMAPQVAVDFSDQLLRRKFSINTFKTLTIEIFEEIYQYSSQKDDYRRVMQIFNIA